MRFPNSKSLLAAALYGALVYADNIRLTDAEFQDAVNQVGDYIAIFKETALELRHISESVYPIVLAEQYVVDKTPVIKERIGDVVEAIGFVAQEVSAEVQNQNQNISPNALSQVLEIFEQLTENTLALMTVEVPVNWKIWTKEIDRKSESLANIWRLIFSLRYQLHIVMNYNNAEIVDWMFGGQYETSYTGEKVWILNPDSVSIRLGALDRIVTAIDGAVMAVNADLNILQDMMSEYPGVSVDSGFIVSQVDGIIKIMTTYINLLDMLRDSMTGVLTEFLLFVED